MELTVKTKKRYEEILSTYFNPYKNVEKFSFVLYLVPNETMKNRLRNIFSDISADSKFVVMTLAHFKVRFTGADLETRHEAVEARRERDRLAQQKRDEERRQQEQERKRKAEQDRLDAEKRKQEWAEREKQAELERERKRLEKLSEERWEKAYRWAVRIGIPFIIIGALFSLYVFFIH